MGQFGSRSETANRLRLAKSNYQHTPRRLNTKLIARLMVAPTRIPIVLALFVAVLGVVSSTMPAWLPASVDPVVAASTFTICVAFLLIIQWCVQRFIPPRLDYQGVARLRVAPLTAALIVNGAAHLYRPAGAPAGAASVMFCMNPEFSLNPTLLRQIDASLTNLIRGEAIPPAFTNIANFLRNPRTLSFIEIPRELCGIEQTYLARTTLHRDRLPSSQLFGRDVLPVLVDLDAQTITQV